MELGSAFGGPARLYCELHLQWHDSVCPICMLAALHREMQQLIKMQQSQIEDLSAEVTGLRRRITNACRMAQDAQDCCGRLAQYIPLDEGRTGGSISLSGYSADLVLP